MVGKGTEPKSSRIFQQCYLKCCKLQNLTPLNNVIPSGNGKVLDFCVDRIKYTEWPPILNALSCDLSLHSVAIKCRNQVKTVLEHIDCERLAKTVNKRAVILTNFMLNNLVEATSQLLANTTLLTTLILEGLPLKIPYLNPLCEALLTNNSLQHVYLPRCLIGDAGCLAICKSVRCLPNILTLDLSGCDLTPIGAGYIADLVKYQKIHRYSENWSHTLRYRLPQLDTMAGLRRITVCANPQLADAGVAKLLDVLSDDLWIKALDIQNCGLSEATATLVLRMLPSNTTLVVLDMRHNADICSESLAKVRAALRDNERGVGGQFSWISSVSGSSSETRIVKYSVVKNGVIKDRTTTNVRNIPTKYVGKTTVVKKEKDYSEILEEQLQEEISHRQQLEELNLQLVDQMKQLKHQQIPLWANGTASSGSEHSLEASSRSCDLSSSSGSSSSVPIDQNTLSYIQQAFKDIYLFIKNNQCYGQCIDIQQKLVELKSIEEVATESGELGREVGELSERGGQRGGQGGDGGQAGGQGGGQAGGQGVSQGSDEGERRPGAAKKAHSTHAPLIDNMKPNKTTKSAHLLGDTQRTRHPMDMKPEMIERQIGDTRNLHNETSNTLEEMIAVQTNQKKGSVHDKSSSSPSSSAASDSDTLVSSRSAHNSTLAINPRDAFSSSDDEDDDEDD